MTDPSASHGTRSRSGALLALLVLAVGVALRVRVHLGERALWIDEAMLALNLVPRGFSGLLEPLDWDQGAPVLWLLLCKVASLLFGTGERALRAPAFLAALVTLPFVLRVARRHLGERAALAATAFFALMPSVVYQASEFKPYTFDALCALVVVALHLDETRGDAALPPTRARLLRLALVGALVVWFSIPAAFVLAGCGTSLMLADLLARRTRAFAARALVATVWAASFGVHFLFLRTLLANARLEAYWQGTAAFLPFPPTSGEDLRLGLELTFGWFRDPLRSPYVDVLSVGSRTGTVAAVAALVGVAALWRRDRRVLGVLALPLGFAAVASALRVYPLQGRLLLFDAPMLALLAGAGLGALLDAGERVARAAGVALLVGLLAWPAVGALEVLRHGPVREEVDDCLERLAGRARPGDRLWVYNGARPAYEYYARSVGRFDESGLEVAFCPPRSESFDDYAPSLAAFDGRGRTWLLFSHVHVGPSGDERARTLAFADTLGTRIETFEAPGASLVLYDL